MTKKIVNNQVVDITTEEQLVYDALQAEYADGQADRDAQEYVRKRLAEYPSIEELTVALWEGVVEERMAAVTRLEGKRQVVKVKYPK